MSLENKFKANLQELYPGMGRVREDSPAAQGSSETNPKVNTLEKAAGTDSVAKAGNSTKLSPSSGGRDAKPAKQGDSEENVETEDLGKDEPGKVAASKMKKGPVPSNNGAGQAPGYTTVADPLSVINQGSSKGNTVKEDLDEDLDEDFITEDEFDALSPEEQEEWELVEVEIEDEDFEEDTDLEESVKVELTFDPAVLFEGDDSLTEEFKTKAASIFEALVTAKVSEIREELAEEAAELATEALAEQVDALVEVLDGYLTEAAIEWIAQNEIAVENGLRTEITENFMTGLRNLFAESYIDVPDEKLDLVGELAEEVESLRAELASQNEITEEVVAELHQIKRDEIVREVSEGLALTQADKLRTLTENVTFEDADSFKAKITAIRGNFFSAKTEVSEVITEQKTVVDNTVAAIANRLPSPNTFSK